VLVDPGIDCHQRRLAIEVLLDGTYGIAHTTLQVDHRDDVLPTSALGRRIHPDHGRRP
jgi:cobalt-zinc-cadmium efflux system protein